MNHMFCPKIWFCMNHLGERIKLTHSAQPRCDPGPKCLFHQLSKLELLRGKDTSQLCCFQLLALQPFGGLT